MRAPRVNRHAYGRLGDMPEKKAIVRARVHRWAKRAEGQRMEKEEKNMQEPEPTPGKCEVCDGGLGPMFCPGCRAIERERIQEGLQNLVDGERTAVLAHIREHATTLRNRAGLQAHAKEYRSWLNKTADKLGQVANEIERGEHLAPRR